MVRLAGSSKTRCCSAADSRRVEREDVEVLAALERVGGVADLALAGEEDEDVARAARAELADGVGDRL